MGSVSDRGRHQATSPPVQPKGYPTMTLLRRFLAGALLASAPAIALVTAGKALAATPTPSPLAARHVSYQNPSLFYSPAAHTAFPGVGVLGSTAPASNADPYQFGPTIAQLNTTVVDDGIDKVSPAGPEMFFVPTSHTVFPGTGSLGSVAAAEQKQGLVRVQDANATVIDNGIDKVAAAGPALSFTPTFHVSFPRQDFTKAAAGGHSGDIPGDSRVIDN